MYRIMQYRMILFTLLLFVWVLTATAQQTGNFPIVTSTEFIEDDEIFIFSNDAEYALIRSSSILDLESYHSILTYYNGASLKTRWSIDNQRVTFLDGNGICENPADQGALVIFYTETESTTRHCIPEISQTSSIEFSPFDSNVIKVGNWILDLSTMVITSYTMPTELTDTMVRNSIGYGQYLWDISTQLPIAKLEFDISADYNADIRGMITKQEIDACLSNCITLVDTLNIDDKVKLVDWEIHRNWLLWVGVKSNLTENVDVVPPTEYNDGIIYLTNIQTGETQELTRSSLLNTSDAVVIEASWSPDAHTIALHLENTTDFRSYIIPDDPSRALYSEGTILLNLDWPQGVTSFSTSPVDVLLDNSKVSYSDVTTIQANTLPTTVGSVIFQLNDIQIIDNEAPYEINIPDIGEYSLVAVPFSESDGMGSAGAQLSSNFNIVELTIPTLALISDTTNTVPTFTWSSVSGAESYLLSVSSTNTSVQESFVAVDVCNAIECSVTLSQPLEPDTYTASVQAANVNTTSDPSNEITFTILDSQPIVIDPNRLCPVDTPVIDFNSTPPFSYGATQDVNGQVVIEENGTALRMTGNTWQQVNFPYVVTSQTVIDFDFQSNAQGELHGMGFDTASNDQKISKKKVYTVYGTQNWGRSDGGRYDEFAPDTTHFGITVGADYTGDVNYLTFVNDHDVDNPSAESVFSNIQVCEFVEPVPPPDPTTCSAQTVLAYAPGPSLASDGLLHPDRMDPSNALGEAQGTDTLNFVSLGYGGELILDMGQRIMNEGGNDLRVIETTYTDTSRSWLVYPEQAIVYASQDLDTWIPLGVARKDMGFDLGSLDWARYIRIVDATNPSFFLGNGTTTDAFDVDAVEAISTCTP